MSTSWLGMGNLKRRPTWSMTAVTKYGGASDHLRVTK